MKSMPIVGAAALAFALAACGTEDSGANNDSEVTTITEDEAGTTDPALTDLNMDAGAGEVDQAINQTDSQAELDNAIEGAGESVENEF